MQSVARCCPNGQPDHLAGPELSPPCTTRRPFLIGIAGGTASGKSVVCQRIISAVNARSPVGMERQIATLSQDCFYRDLDYTEQMQAKKGIFNFDHPDAFDHDLMLTCLERIHQGHRERVPVYDYVNNARAPDHSVVVEPSSVVLVEGILVFYSPAIRNMFDLKLFVDTDPDTRLARRVLRDIECRGRSLDTILKQYTDLVKPAFEDFCLPTKKFADVIIPRGAENKVAIDLVAQHILDIIDQSQSPTSLTPSRRSSVSRIR